MAGKHRKRANPLKKKWKWRITLGGGGYLERLTIAYPGYLWTSKKENALAQPRPQIDETLKELRKRLAQYTNDHPEAGPPPPVRRITMAGGVVENPPARRPRKNPAVGGLRLIYPRVGAVIAQKNPSGADGHPCGARCRKKRHWYIHKFGHKVNLYGRPDGSMVLQ